MSAVIHARVIEQLTRLRLRYVADRLDAVLSEAARTEPTYLDFLDGVLRQEVEAKQRTRTTMGLKIAHFPTVKTLDDFDFKFQPSSISDSCASWRPHDSSPRRKTCSSSARPG